MPGALLPSQARQVEPSGASAGPPHEPTMLEILTQPPVSYVLFALVMLCLLAPRIRTGWRAGRARLPKFRQYWREILAVPVAVVFLLQISGVDLSSLVN